MKLNEPERQKLGKFLVAGQTLNIIFLLQAYKKTPQRLLWDSNLNVCTHRTTQRSHLRGMNKCTSAAERYVQQTNTQTNKQTNKQTKQNKTKQPNNTKKTNKQKLTNNSLNTCFNLRKKSVRFANGLQLDNSTLPLACVKTARAEMPKLRRQGKPIASVCSFFS